MKIEGITKDEEMICPECGELCCRDSVHNGLALLYGPWGCFCGWSDDARYSHSSKHDPFGGYTPKQKVD